MQLRPWRRKHKRNELDSRADLEAFLSQSASPDLRGVVVQAVDLSGVCGLEAAQLEGCLFLGCRFTGQDQEDALRRRGAGVVPRLGDFPFDPFRSALYTPAELLEGFEAGGYAGTRDAEIYQHFSAERHHPEGRSILVSLAERLHDHGVDDALEEFLEAHAGRGVVGIMGGHGVGRSDPVFAQVTEVAWGLTRAGYLVASGGGPGVMEAANLGATLGNYADPSVLQEAIELLRPAETYHGGEAEGSEGFAPAVQAYYRCARSVLARFGPSASPGDAERFQRERAQSGRSLAIPTWFYGHEPSNLFSEHIAKYFSNGLREEGLLACSLGGVVYAPGSAGTLQEVFMDLAQNHYATYAYRSPMVFLGRERYRALYEFVQEFVRSKGKDQQYGDLLALVDQPEEAVAFIEAHPPRLED